MSKSSELILNIEGMHCASCVSRIEQGVKSLDCVSECQVNLATRSGVVLFQDSRLDEQAVISRIGEMGFKATVGQVDVPAANRSEEIAARRRFMVSLLGTVPLMAIAMWPMLADNYIYSSLSDGLAQAFLSGIVLFYSGRLMLRDAFVQTRHLAVNMNTLISLGTLTAFGWSLYALYETVGGASEPLYFASTGMIITLILLGRMLEAKVRRRAGGAIEELLKMQPVVAAAVINGTEIEIDPAAATPGMILLVKPNERVPVDGEVTEGSPVIDESLLTGESEPVEKGVGHQVLGGSVNGNTTFGMKVTATGEDSFLASVARLVSEAQSRKAPIQRRADRVASVLVPTVLAVAVLTGLAWFWWAPHSPMLVQSIIAVLIVACPSALGLATPTAVLAGTGRGTRAGIIIKGGDTLEQLSTVDAVIFDKTGTLTRGELEVVRLKIFGQTSEQSLLRITGSMESQSQHPVAKAIVRHMNDRQIEPVIVKNVEARPGFGMVAECDGRRVVIGNRAMMEQESISFGPSLLQGEHDMRQGRTVVFAAMDGQVIGLLSLADRIKGDARELITELTGRMQRVAMISGDNRQTVSSVAQSIGLEHFEAEIRPDQKQMFVDSYRRAGFTVAMVGDGINDAPVLAAADVGIALGSGTDVATETADVVLVRTELGAVARLLNLSRQTMKTIRQNLFWVFFYNVLTIPLAAGLFYPWFGLTLSPVLAALVMSLSSVLVESNSLRLSRIEL